ncbi:hypothetical protein [Salipiger sp. CCB-MM3]|uniref:hypothetical protein n=1 Tax=Salipiger sp. CCB-MM3 TaxID=1792508 RepID=UPI000A7F3FBA|nr:hypothetical protein [Salipiger sp. CCB-MM3]
MIGTADGFPKSQSDHANTSRPLGGLPRARYGALAAGALSLACLCTLLCSGAARAQQVDAAALQQAIAAQVTPLLTEPQILAALAEQNAATSGYDAAQIDALDARWRAEIGAAETPTISPVLENPVSQMLMAYAYSSHGLITEVFVMDGQGLNVAMSHITSDFWQGDEAKFLETVPRGAGALHVGDVEFDESSQHYLVQVSMTISDPDSGAPLGAH